MTVKLSEVTIGTEFTYEGNKYRTSGCRSNSFLQTNYRGVREDDCRLISCEPFLGGQFQVNLRVWFNINTEVEIN